ncbi:MAG: M28 family metallopeptidase [Armatimonadetes bacterium]|nr:M28 family metallopeptidase [Armatimonadota bacterium]MDE2207943.1 M28 family metallopeptidase [Armatimonadota bacterium]
MRAEIGTTQSALAAVVTLIAIGGPASPAAAQSAPRSRIDADVAQIARSIRPASIRRDIETLVSFGTRNTMSAQNDPKFGIGAASRWIYARFRAAARLAHGRMSVEMVRFIQPQGPRIPEPTPLTDVVAILHGDDEGLNDRAYVMSGHYDSICSNPVDSITTAPGADDDGSGVAATLESAMALAPYHFRATIVFECVAGEEQGLYGSAYMAHRFKLAGARIDGVLNNDIIGGDPIYANGPWMRTVRLFAEGIASRLTPRQLAILRYAGAESDSPARELARWIAETANVYVPSPRVQLIFRTDRYLRSGDQVSYLDQGFPAVRFTESHENFHHQHQTPRIENGVQYGDLPQFVNWRYAARVARINAVSIAGLARAPAAPAAAWVVARSLTNDTTLRWQPSRSSNATGYEVIWRETTSPTWTHARWAGSATSFTLRGISKDDFLFGVRAVSPHGRRSPVTFAMPGR